MNRLLLSLFLCCSFAPIPGASQSTPLQDLFRRWRAFEVPPLSNGAPDYSRAAFTARMPSFEGLKQELLKIDTIGWSVTRQNDWKIVWAEMNGFDFNHRILRPWERDPAFYKMVWTERSDVPAHEGPTPHFATEIWKYSFPLSPDASGKLREDIRRIPPFCRQAKENLTGNARDLWIAGIRDIETQIRDLKDILLRPGVRDDLPLVDALGAAIAASDDFASWLRREASSKTGPSGIGKEAYTEYLQKVHLVPLTWEDEVLLLKRELARAWSSLKLEEHRNRLLPPLRAAASPEEYALRADTAATNLMAFLSTQDVFDVKSYYDAALREHPGQFVPEPNRNFFWITAHYDQRPLFSHFFHWFELADLDRQPHPNPIRREPLLFNIFDSRSEGIATAVEELFMQAGLYDDQPRVREIVYIMLAQRAARGLGSLYAHANSMTMEEAGGLHVDWTPRGWMRKEKELRIFEQQLYLRQPGYGTSYVTGKYLFEMAMADYARQQEALGLPFSLKSFFSRLSSIGLIPMDLCRQELAAEW